MKVNFTASALIMALLVSTFHLSTASARELAGVTLDEQVVIEGVEQPLVLNGAAIRYKFFFKVYVGALYLTEKTQAAQTVLQGEQANRVVMHFLYDEVPAKKLVNAWNEGFAENNDKQLMQGIGSRLEKFNSLFGDVSKGDVVLLDYVPGEGTRVNIRGQRVGLIQGADFNRALLSVWLGEEPVTEELKQGMLGQEADD